MSQRHIASRVRAIVAALVLGAGSASAVSAQEADAARQQFLTSCGVCHTVEADAPPRQGPNLLGIFGRKAGKIQNFKYSDALAKADLTWDEPTLDRWIEDAAAVLPGTIMPYRQRDPDKRKLVIDFLKSLKP